MFSLFLCFFLLISSRIYFCLCFNPSNCTFASKMINYWGAATFVSNFHSLQKTKQTKPHKLPRPNSCKTLCNRWRNGNTGSNMRNYLTSFDNGCHSCICSMLLFDVCFLSGFEAAVDWGCFKCWQYKVCKQKNPQTSEFCNKNLWLCMELSVKVHHNHFKRMKVLCKTITSYFVHSFIKSSHKISYSFITVVKEWYSIEVGLLSLKLMARSKEKKFCGVFFSVLLEHFPRVGTS